MAAAVQALECGDTISTDTKLRRHLLNCPEDGLIIDTPGVTLNLNGKRITGKGNGAGISIEGDVHNVTVRNGRVWNFANQMVIKDSDGVLVRHMDLRGREGRGMLIERSENLEVRHSRIRDLKNSGLLVIEAHDLTFRNNRVTHVGIGGSDCGGGAGVSILRSDRVKIKNNLFKRISRAGILLTDARDSQLSGNTIVNTTSRPCSRDFGAIGIDAVSRGTVVAHNWIVGNHGPGIGLKDVEDIEIRRNRLWRNEVGVFLSDGAPGTTLNYNCIAHHKSDVGLEVDPTDSNSQDYDIDATHNYWGARSGPSGSGPMGTELNGTGEEIIQGANHNIQVIPFKTRCR